MICKLHELYICSTVLDLVFSCRNGYCVDTGAKFFGTELDNNLEFNRFKI